MQLSFFIVAELVGGGRGGGAGKHNKGKQTR